MTRLERIARDLASVLSAEGEADWRRFLALARQVARRVDRDFDVVMGTDAGSGPAASSSASASHEALRRRPAGKEI